MIQRNLKYLGLLVSIAQETERHKKAEDRLCQLAELLAKRRLTKLELLHRFDCFVFSSVCALASLLTQASLVDRNIA